MPVEISSDWGEPPEGLGPPDEPTGSDAAVVEVLRPVNWHELWADESPAIEWFAEPLVARGQLTAIYSPPKAGKSLLMLELAAAIASGRPVLGRRTTRARVMYLDLENDPHGDIVVRLRDMGYRPDDLDDLLLFSFPQLPPLNTDRGGRELLALALAHEADVVIIDTVSRIVVGEENANDTWLDFYRYTGLRLKRAGIACVRLDHAGKDVGRGQRGGSAKGGDVDVVWRLTASGDTLRLVREMTRKRLPEADRDMTLVRRLDPLRHVLGARPNADARQERIDNLVRELDRLDITLEAGRDAVSKVLRAEGVKYTNEELSEAIKSRRNLSEHLSGQVSARNLSADGSDSHGQEPLT